MQILKAYGYTNLLATASPTHHAFLKRLGAKEVFDYRSASVSESILTAAPKIAFVLDCIGSKDGSLAGIVRVVQKGAKVAALLPVTVRDANESAEPEYSLDVQGSANWADGVEVKGVRAHFYLDVSDYILNIAFLGPANVTCNRTNSSAIISNQ